MRILFLMFSLPLSCCGFGSEGHRCIAEVAYKRLPPEIKARVDSILGEESIADASVWPDLIRSGKMSYSPDGKAFNKANPQNREWHYVNLPLGTTAYSRTNSFASTNDIVHAIDGCIAVLEGRSKMMNKHDALRWLIHLAGDIHQPLHISCGYYSFEPSGKYKLISNPLDASGRDHDRGGNRLQYGKSSSLHSYWDSHMVDHLTTKRSGNDLNKIISATVSRLRYKNNGDYHEWPVTWASQSIATARKIYSGVRLGKKYEAEGDWKIYVSLSKTYDDVYAGIARQQLAMAAYNLSEILKAIRWQ